MEKKRPVHEVSLEFNDSFLRAAIWRHQKNDEPPRFTISFSRRYMPKGESKWTYSDFFTRDELLGLSRVAELAHSWIITSEVSGGNKNE